MIAHTWRYQQRPVRRRWHQAHTQDLLKVGGSGMLGLSLGSMLQMQAKANESGHGGGPGWDGQSVILVYLQGGRVTSISGTLLDVPDNVRSVFKTFPPAFRARISQNSCPSWPR